ncbi:mrg-binding protein [Plakobranchus ocellatus]|uniref:Mrg-binding protein n=1 Tax=Plakobranchus ocellatus TaxID=259542 RepID=A0AAV4DBB1_9GAST|nr:mrg-binding protein [Plakobranchus ocellatus]
MATVSSASDFLWNVDMEVNLFHAMRGHKPAGVNRHFQMIAIHEKLSSASKKLSSEDVWKHLSTLYDLQALNESEIIPFPNKSTDFCLPESSTTGLSDHTFPRSSYINTSASDSQKPDAPSKVIPKSVSKPDSKAPPQTPTPQKSESSKPDSKPPSAKSQSHKAGGGVGGSGGSSSTSKSGGGLQSQALFTPDPSPKRTKRTRNVPSTGSSPITPTEPASKRRR